MTASRKALTEWIPSVYLDNFTVIPPALYAIRVKPRTLTTEVTSVLGLFIKLVRNVIYHTLFDFEFIHTAPKLNKVAAEKKGYFCNVYKYS